MTTDITATEPRTGIANAAAPVAAVNRSTFAPVSRSTATTKSDTVTKLLLRAKGATPVELIAATDWQPHSVRAFLSGLRKKGRIIVREARKSGEAAYRIETSANPVIAGLAEPATTPVAEQTA